MPGCAADMLSDEAAAPLLRQRRSLDLFAGTVLISLLLHLAVSVVLVLPGRFNRPGGAPIMVELHTLQELPAAPTTPLLEEAEAVQPDADAETPPSASAPAPATATATATLDAAVAASLRRAAGTPDAVHESAIGLGMIAGRFASFAEGATLKDDVKSYYFTLMRRINEVWWTGTAAARSLNAPASVNLTISRDGKLLACELLESSGSSEQDRLLLAVVRSAEPLPPLPTSYVWPTFNAPIRFVPPLRLMLPGFGSRGEPGVTHGK